MRYRRLNFGDLKLLSKQQLVKRVPFINHLKQPCKECPLGKHHRSSFPKESTFRAFEPLQLVHTNICGPISPNSFGESKYFLTFTDNFSRKTWVYFLKNKSEVFEILKKFKISVEKESGYFLKSIKSDRGEEFTSKKFIVFCEEQGIQHSLTAPYSPQQNGVAESRGVNWVGPGQQPARSRPDPGQTRPGYGLQAGWPWVRQLAAQGPVVCARLVSGLARATLSPPL